MEAVPSRRLTTHARRFSHSRNVRLVVALILLIDRLTKQAIQSQCAPAQSLPLIPHVLHLTYVQNTGAAFGLFRGHTEWFIVFSVAVAAWIIRELRQGPAQNWRTACALALILGGAMGNLIDRLRYGYVVDFIDVRIWPVFNIADSAITVGVTWLLIHALFGKPEHRVS